MRSFGLGASLQTIFVFLAVSVSFAFEIEGKYATILYEKEEHLRTFNKNLFLGSLAYLLKGKRGITVSEEVSGKTDAVVEQVRQILGMFPDGFKLTIVLLPTEKEVNKAYRDSFSVDSDFIAFYSPRDKTMYLSVKHVELGVLAHETAHAVVSQYFVIPPPAKIQEVLAQYVETQITD